MRLGEIMSHMDLAVFPQIGLVLFLAIFVAAMWRVLRSSRSEMAACAAIPLDDRAVLTPRGAEGVSAGDDVKSKGDAS